jgi:hypothetical protein
MSLRYGEWIWPVFSGVSALYEGTLSMILRYELPELLSCSGEGESLGRKNAESAFKIIRNISAYAASVIEARLATPPFGDPALFELVSVVVIKPFRVGGRRMEAGGVGEGGHPHGAGTGIRGQMFHRLSHRLLNPAGDAGVVTRWRVAAPGRVGSSPVWAAPSMPC